MTFFYFHYLITTPKNCSRFSSETQINAFLRSLSAVRFTPADDSFLKLSHFDALSMMQRSTFFFINRDRGIFDYNDTINSPAT